MKIARASILLLIVICFHGFSKAASTLHVLEVGYGQAVHLEVGFSHYLFDVGPTDVSSALLQHLGDRAVTRLSGIFLSHTHPDHIGNLHTLLSQIKTDHVYWNEQYPPDEDTVVLLDKSLELIDFTLLKPGDTIQLGKNIRVKVLQNGLATNNLNNNSLIFGLEYQRYHLLISGDAELERQKKLAELEPKWLKKTNWLLWPHHGHELDSSFSQALGKVDFCVISVGENEYDLPHESTEESQKNICRSFYRTDRDGSLTFILSRKITLSQKNPAEIR